MVEKQGQRSCASWEARSCKECSYRALWEAWACSAHAQPGMLSLEVFQSSVFSALQNLHELVLLH